MQFSKLFIYRKAALDVMCADCRYVPRRRAKIANISHHRSTLTLRPNGSRVRLAPFVPCKHTRINDPRPKQVGIAMGIPIKSAINKNQRAPSIIEEILRSSIGCLRVFEIKTTINTNINRFLIIHTTYI